METNDFFDILNDFPKFFHVQDNKPWATGAHFNWTKEHSVNFTRTFYRTGFCYTFNLPSPDKIFNLQEYINYSLLKLI